MDTEANVVREPLLNPMRTVLLQLAVFNVVMMLLTIGFERNLYVSSVLLIITVFGWNIGIFAWIRADSRKRGFSLHPKFSYAVVLFGILAFIYYLFRSRGFVNAWPALGYAFLFVLSADAVAIFFGIVLFVIILIVQGPNALSTPPPPSVR